jgi:hypothetical protein
LRQQFFRTRGRNRSMAGPSSLRIPKAACFGNLCLAKMRRLARVQPDGAALKFFFEYGTGLVPEADL